MATEKTQRLFIKKVEMENVGRFYGSGHSIELSDSVDQNITVVIGLSGRGKSTIHDMIYWCLYGEFKEHSRKENERLDYGFMNSDTLENLSQGKTAVATVTISLHDNDGEKYQLVRQLKATYNRDSSARKWESQNNSNVPSGIDFETTVKLHYKEESGEKAIQKKPQIVKNEINRYFPQHLSDFFLFDGENLLKFNTSSSSEFIKNGITKISGLEILNSMADSAKNTAINIAKHIGGKSTNASPFASTQSNLMEDKRKIKNEINEYKQKQKNAKQLYEEIIEKINRSKEGNELNHQEKQMRRTQTHINKELTDVKDSIKNTFFERIPQLLLHDTLRKSEEIFAKLEDQDKIPPSISKAAIDKILGSNPLKCVCGLEFEKSEEQDSPWMVLNRIKDTIIEDDISQGISLGRDLISRIIVDSDIKKTRKEFTMLKTRRRDKRKELDECKVEISDIITKMKDIQYDTSEDLSGLKNQYFEQINECEYQIRKKSDDLEDLEYKINENDKKLREAIAKEGRYENESKKIHLAESVERFTRDLEKRIEEILRSLTEKATSKYFLESAPEKDTFDHVSISENYDIVVKDSKEKSAKLSKGQAHVLGLSYVAGIREVTHTNTFLIIDSPLHNISGKARNEISEVFSKYLPDVQLVLLVTDTEYLHGDPEGAESVKNILRKSGHVWKEYVINSKDVEGIESRQIVEYDNGRI